MDRNGKVQQSSIFDYLPFGKYFHKTDMAQDLNKLVNSIKDGIKAGIEWYRDALLAQEKYGPSDPSGIYTESVPSDPDGYKGFKPYVP